MLMYSRTPCQQVRWHGVPVGTVVMYDSPELEIRSLEIKRLRELEKKVALFGPHTEAAIFVEIQSLYNKYPDARIAPAGRERQRDLDFLMNVVAAGLQRLTQLEERFQADATKRIPRQLVHDLWMLAVTVLMFVLLFLVLWS